MTSQQEIQLGKKGLTSEFISDIEKRLEKHRNAIYDYSHYLSTKNKKLFYKAWYEYYCHEDLRSENGIPFFKQYSCQGLMIEKEHQMKSLVKKRIESILEFSTK